MKKQHKHSFTSSRQQRGAALVITLVVLLVLTIVGIASTDSNRVQAALARNTQFRLATFNASYTEIDAQIDTINTTSTIDAGIPDSIRVLIERENGSINSDDNSDLVPIISQHPEMDQRVQNNFAGKCLVFGSNIDVANKVRDCNVIRLDSLAGLDDTAITSDQAQNYRYETFKAL